MSNAIETRQTKQKELIIAQLKLTPIVQIACSKCNIARSTYYLWAKEDKDFAAKVEAAVEYGTNMINDLAESQLVTLIKDGNISAIFYWLNHRHGKYSNKLEITTKGGSDELTHEQGKSIKNALVLASLINPINGKEHNEQESIKEKRKTD
ncbi:MAG: phBC6A51 family helix-turn-helix protein [Candidatus Berkelbacteria bacterium]|nr:phBC6A51 family helix-turn-helix protein [Candidatus Berkelbacteria bacterium]